MAHKLNLSLTDELSRHVDARVGNDNIYATPDVYIRDLIRRDMQDWEIVRDIAQGLREARNGEYVVESILDVLREE